MSTNGAKKSQANGTQQSLLDMSRLLEKCQITSVDFETCKIFLRPWVESIVTSLGATHHTSGLSEASKENLKTLTDKFFLYLEKSNEWKSIIGFTKTPNTPHTMISKLLSRSYLRFEKQNAHTPKSLTPSNKSQITDTLANISSYLFNSFEEQVETIGDLNQRICFQLYLDGLIIPEIALLLQTSEQEVQKHISSTKEMLTNELEESEYGT